MTLDARQDALADGRRGNRGDDGRRGLRPRGCCGDVAGVVARPTLVVHARRELAADRDAVVRRLDLLDRLLGEGDLEPRAVRQSAAGSASANTSDDS